LASSTPWCSRISLPACFLILAAFSPNLYLALGLVVAALGAVANGRADPTSYVHGGGDAGGASRAASVTAVPRSLASAISPAISGRAADDGLFRLAAGGLRQR